MINGGDAPKINMKDFNIFKDNIIDKLNMYDFLENTYKFNFINFIENTCLKLLHTEENSRTPMIYENTKGLHGINESLWSLVNGSEFENKGNYGEIFALKLSQIIQQLNN